MRDRRQRGAIVLCRHTLVKQMPLPDDDISQYSLGCSYFKTLLSNQASLSPA
jgi:hypothetical protein